jgi:hypothetical protein
LITSRGTRPEPETRDEKIEREIGNWPGKTATLHKKKNFGTLRPRAALVKKIEDFFLRSSDLFPGRIQKGVVTRSQAA